MPNLTSLTLPVNQNNNKKILSYKRCTFKKSIYIFLIKSISNETSNFYFPPFFFKEQLKADKSGH